MTKTFEVISSYLGNKEIRVYENGKRILDIMLSDHDIDGACEILEALGYHLLYRAY